jgi:cellulose synthase/poly-beta-1,6-N-acetylglucosamine synthase-like glycosyltransferase/glycosyltransferase involved in cell wall biosynthesis/O-antigen/teichoic acid export membrane protein
MANKIKLVSIIIPVYNEKENIQELFARISSVFSHSKYSCEIICIDDHSPDGTYEYVKELSLSNVRIETKQGKKGKAFSLKEGFSYATGDAIVMIDADLQYPPEEILAMIKKLDTADIVVANRKEYKAGIGRKIKTNGFRKIFGGMLFDLHADIQSGLKVFTKDVIDTISFLPKTGWTFDLEFLHRASQAGFRIENHDITFHERENGKSNVNFRSIFEIGLNALSLRTKQIRPLSLASKNTKSMLHAGVGYKKKQYITHTTLPSSKSAIITFELRQKMYIAFVLFALITGLAVAPFITLMSLIAFLSVLYFVDVLFNLFIVFKSLQFPQEITVPQVEIAALSDRRLPTYTILCPLYKEAHIIPQFLDSISKMDWPKNKLEVMLLLEEDDTGSISSVKKMQLPKYVKVVVVPHSFPKTKPKACNYGLSHAKGEYLVIYDAEDIPDPMQLKIAYLAFQTAPKNVLCLQAKLNYFNPSQNLLTRFFTAEYSLWFDVTLTGLQSLQTTIPLGGTSNHFRTKDLLRLEGWDPFNVTEDADLGMRLFKDGYKTAIIDSITLEEANSKVKNWIRQRSRWIKGYMQTYLVHNREIVKDIKNQKLHTLFFHLTIGGKIAFILINPLLWIATISYFTLYSIVGPTIESLYPASIFYMAAFSLIVGNFLFLYYYMIGCLKRGHYDLIKYVYLIPLYWLLISVAGLMALQQLIFKPHYWEKTVHGLHLKQSEMEIEEEVIEPETAFEPRRQRFAFPSLGFTGKTKELTNRLRTAYVSGGALIAAAIFSNILNFIFNAYLGRVIDISYFAEVSLVGSFLYIVNIPVSALSSTVRYRSGFLAGRYGISAAYAYWKETRLKTCIAGVITAGIWSASSVLLSNYFHTSSILPFLLFAPYIVASFINVVDTGYLSGKLLFGALAIVIISEPILKLIIAIAAVSFHISQFAYVAIPFSTVGSFIIAWIYVKRNKEEKEHQATPREISTFSKRFFIASTLSGLSNMSFLSLDIILANHFLSKTDAGIYALLALSGKMIYFLGNLATQFVTPLVSRHEGANTNSKKTFQQILLATILLALIGFGIFGALGQFTLPVLFGSRAKVILPFILFYTLAMVCFTISRVYTSYYLVKKVYIFSFVGFILTLLQFGLVYMNHASVYSFVFAMYIVGAFSLFSSIVLHLNIGFVYNIERVAIDFFGLFKKSKITSANSGTISVLIFNWRDTHHIWSGGAEIYIQEIAKRWVKNGASVTLFCGNDGHSPKTQMVDGIEVIRRGGTYLVYMWAFLYYVLKFRGKYDVIIDCENGIPFFTPLFTTKKIFLLVHHVHQEVFREHLMFPLSSLARFLEGSLMPFVYRNHSVVTVSESSKIALENLGITKARNIQVIHNGINHAAFTKRKKTKNPSISYLGRLKPYKNVDIAIKAFQKIYADYPSATLSIIGDGESKKKLMNLVKKLELSNAVTFCGKVSEKEKATLLAKSWVVVQPSMAEGWGITVIEANAAGTPVIASNVSGLKDSVIDNHTGLLVKVRDIAVLENTLRKVITDNAYREYLSENAHIWSQNFNWDTSSENFYRLITDESIISSSPSLTFASK